MSKIIYDGSFVPAKNEGFEEEFTRNVVADVGINCYCEHAKNLLLWSHYGDSHKGIALGFDLREGYFQMPHDPADRRIIMKVDYPESNTRKVIDWKNEIALLPDELQLQRVLQTGYAVKGWDWKYEDEYREFVFLSKCIPSGMLYFSEFRPDSLREVILGERCSLKAHFVRRLINHADPYRHGGDVLRARSDPDSFSMIITDAFKED